MVTLDELAKLGYVLMVEDEIGREDSEFTEEELTEIISDINLTISLDDINPQDIVNYRRESEKYLKEYREELNEVLTMKDYLEEKLENFGSYMNEEEVYSLIQYKVYAAERRIDELEQYIGRIEYNLDMLNIVDNKLSVKEVR